MARNDATGFAAQIDAEMKECDLEITAKIVAITLEALESLIDKTPVRTGKSRGGWYVVVGEGSDSVALPVADKDGATTLQNGVAALIGYGADGKKPVISIINRQRPINILESGGGRAKPYGMLALTLGRANGEVWPLTGRTGGPWGPERRAPFF